MRGFQKTEKLKLSSTHSREVEGRWVLRWVTTEDGGGHQLWWYDSEAKRYVREKGKWLERNRASKQTH